MVFTNAGAEFVALRLGSSLPDMTIQTYGIGSGSGTASIADTELLGERDRTFFTQDPDYSTPQVISVQGDFNSVQMSGTNLTEFGLFTDIGASTGSLWLRESIADIEFDGTNELQITTSIKVIAESGT